MTIGARCGSCNQELLLVQLAQPSQGFRCLFCGFAFAPAYATVPPGVATRAMAAHATLVTALTELVSMTGDRLRLDQGTLVGPVANVLPQVEAKAKEPGPARRRRARWRPWALPRPPAVRLQEEFAAHFAQGSPALAAMDWVNGFLSRGLGAVWAWTDPDLRLAITQTSIMTNQTHPEITGQDRDRLAARIVHADRSDDWTEDVLDHLDDEFRKGMPAWFLGGRCGVPSQPGPVTPGYELVLFLETNEEVPTPGWPPR